MTSATDSAASANASAYYPADKAGAREDAIVMSLRL
jgi:hypothetical protein